MIDSYIAIDIETTGLNPKTQRIIEIGAVKVVKGFVTEETSMLIQPKRLLEERIIELTGIDDQMLEQAPCIGEVIGTIVEFCQGLPLLGHHIMFDYSFLKRAAVNHGFSFEKTGVDTLALCRQFMPEESKKNLTSACEYFQIVNQNSHRALADAYAAHELYQALGKQFGETDSQVFLDKPLVYKVKKEQPATKSQKERLHELIKYHKIIISVQIESLSRNEISRMTDKIISQYGRIVKR